METTMPMMMTTMRKADAAASVRRRQALWGQVDGRAANRVAFGPARRGCTSTSRELIRTNGIGQFFGIHGSGEHGNKDHEVDVDTAPARLFVGLPIDSVTDGATVNSAAAVAAGIRAVRLLGADGVELPVFWSVAQPESPDRFSWAGYRAVADMARAEGLGLRVSLRCHGSPGAGVPTIPAWVKAAGADDPDIFFTDRSGVRHDCLSFAIDDLPVLHGKSPLQLYEAFFRSFAAAFHDLLGSTITDVTIGLGANGVLRYPSYPPGSDDRRFTGVGEFQCYDKYMLAALRHHAEQSGQPLWGTSPPHDAPRYHESPDACGFFREEGGSWESPYGDFFLSWYASRLVGHGDRVLGTARAVFAGDEPVELSAKVPFMHWWHGARSRPAEATAGFYKSNKKNGYSPVAKMFARHGCSMVVPGMDVCVNKQHHSTGSSPDKLLVQIKNACRRYAVPIAGENASLVMTHTSSFSRIRSNVLTTDRMRPQHFTYQRMGAEFFSPDHFPRFMEFLRSVVCGEWDEDDDREVAVSGAWEARAA